MNIKTFLIKEFKRTDMSKILLVVTLISAMLLITYIGQLGKLEQKLGLNLDGLNNLILTLSSKDYNYVLTKLGLGVGFFVSIIVYTLFQGLPYCLNFYTYGREEGSLIYLLITPVKIKSIILGTSIYSILRISFMTVVTFISLYVFTLINGVWLNFTFDMFISIIVILVIIFNLFLIINCLLWIFNGNRIVINLFKTITLVLVLIYVPISTKSIIVLPSIEHTGIISLITLFISFILLFITEKVYSKEKMLLNSNKDF